MKKGLSAILAMLLILSMALAGCGSGEPDISGTIQPNTQPTQGETTPTEPEENPLSLGRFEGGVYTNHYLGLGCTLDSNWVFASAEELQELPSGVADAMEGSDIGDLMDSYTQIADMQAENANDLTTMNILYVKVGLQERLMYLAMTEEQIIDSILAQSDMLIEGYTQTGITVNEMKKVTVTFLGKEHTALWTSATVQGVSYYLLQLYDYTAGEYSATITLGSFVEDKTASLLDLFYEVE